MERMEEGFIGGQGTQGGSAWEVEGVKERKKK